MLIVIAFLGYVLPWGQMSYWGATVITNVLSFIPDIVEWICGSFFVYNPTLNRFFVLHFILPFLVMCLLLFHIFYLHLLGSSNPLGSINTNNKVTFFSYILNKDIYGFLILFTLYCMQLGYGLLLVSHPDNALEVNILVTPFHIVPEWYLLPFYAILRSVPDKLLGVVAMLSAILILAVLPWLDTSKIRSAVFRPLYKQFYWILVADVLILGYVGAMPAEGLYLLIARVVTAYYFLHFLVILPVLGFKEKTLPVPLSITEPVLGGSPNLATARKKESKIE